MGRTTATLVSLSAQQSDNEFRVFRQAPIFHNQGHIGTPRQSAMYRFDLRKTFIRLIKRAAVQKEASLKHEELHDRLDSVDGDTSNSEGKRSSGVAVATIGKSRRTFLS